MSEPEKPGDRVAEVARAVGCQEDVVRLAGFPEQKLTEIFDSAQRSAKISRYISRPAAAITIGLMLTNAFLDAGPKDVSTVFMGASFLTFIGSGLLDKRFQLRDQIETAALERGAERDKQNPPTLS